MALPGLTYSQVDFSSGQITAKAARRDDVKLQRSGLKTGANIRALASGALAQRFGRSAYDLDTGRTETVRFSDTLKYEFLFGDAALRIRDMDGTLLNEFPADWTLDTIDEIGVAVAERDVFLTYGANRPLHLALGSSDEIDSSLGTAIGDMIENLDFPVVVNIATSQNPTTKNHTVALASGEPGDLLIVSFKTGGNTTTHTPPGGWTLLAERHATGSTSIFYRKATGSEGSSITITSTGSAGRYSVAICRRIRGFRGTPEASFTGSNSLDPPSLTPSWGSARTLWLALASMRRSDQTLVTDPAGYADAAEIGNPSSSVDTRARIADATKNAEATSDNPATFVVTGTADEPHAATIAVQPLSDVTELETAFDAVTNRVAAECVAAASATAAYIGLDFSATPQQVTQAIVHGSNDQGYVDGLTPTVTLTLYGKNGSAPSASNDGTSLGTTAFTDTANESGARTVTSSDTTTLWDYLWLEVSHNGVAADIYVAQVVFEKPSLSLAADNWLLSNFIFEITGDGAKRQPYYRFAPRGITLLCSARTGTAIDMTFSEPVLAASHVGVSFRFHEREIIITSVTSATTAKANVIETLPPTRRVVCASANGRDSFKLGQVVIGETTGAEGLITAFNSTANLDVIVYKGDNFLDTERIVSPTGQTIVTGTPAEVTLQASPVWDEALMNDYRGWPRSVSYDRSRLIFCDFPQLPRALAESAIGAPRDMLIGAEPAAAFLELIPAAGRVLHVIGGADQYVLTDLGVMYIPISEANPLAPGSVAFRAIAAIGAGHVRPVSMHEGVVYAVANRKSLIAIVPTGQTAFPYRTAAISEFHADLFTGIRALAAMTGGGAESEQYLWVAQDDGTALVGKFDSSNEWVGFVPVTGDGLVKWISSLGGDVRFNVQYQDDDSELDWAMEQLDEDQFVDCAVPLNKTLATLRPDPEDLTKGRLWFLAGLVVDLMDGDEHLGARTVDENGDIVTVEGDDFSGDDVIAGFGWTVTVEPWLPSPPEGEERGQRMRRRRVKRAAATIVDSTTLVFMGRTFGGAAAASDTYRAPGEGRSFTPAITLSKTVPGPLTILELAGEITN